MGALAILDKLRAANDAARQKQSNIASAAEARRIAELAFDARSKGKLTTAAVIARYEDVTRLDPDVFVDWIELSRLYVAAGRLPDAARAVRHARETAQSERDRSVALEDLGNILFPQGDLAGADTAYAEVLTISRKLAAADPSNAEAQRDVSISLSRIGNVRVAQGNLAGAETAYAEGLTIARKLAAADPGNAEAQRDVWVSLSRLAGLKGSSVRWREVVTQMEAMDAKGTLAPSDRPYLDRARAKAAREVGE